ncbi:MAG TPA: hypothetical protein VD859_14470 [Nocardioides sp.]|nr:hypothetical protein [Nocardioides sp.]
MTPVMDQEQRYGGAAATMLVVPLALELVAVTVWLLLTVLGRL